MYWRIVNELKVLFVEIHMRKVLEVFDDLMFDASLAVEIKSVSIAIETFWIFVFVKKSRFHNFKHTYNYDVAF